MSRGIKVVDCSIEQEIVTIKFVIQPRIIFRSIRKKLLRAIKEEIILYPEEVKALQFSFSQSDDGDVACAGIVFHRRVAMVENATAEEMQHCIMEATTPSFVCLSTENDDEVDVPF